MKPNYLAGLLDLFKVGRQRQQACAVVAAGWAAGRVEPAGAKKRGDEWRAGGHAREMGTANARVSGAVVAAWLVE